MKLDIRKTTIASEDSSRAFYRVPLSQSEPSTVAGNEEAGKSTTNGNIPTCTDIKAESSDDISSRPDKENSSSGILNIDSKNVETYSCPLCNHILPSPHAFTIHIRQHNPSDHSHTCRLCGKTLSSASSLDRHMLVHSGERPFKCRLCSMAFTTNGNMHRHMRTHGEDNVLSSSSKQHKESKGKKRKPDGSALSNSALPKKREIDESDQAHCPVCDKAFSDALSLQNHMELHPDDPIWCKECCQALTNYSVYVDHPCVKFPNKIEANQSISTCVGFQDLTFMDFSTNKFSLVAKSLCENNSRRPSSAFHAFECNKCDKSFPCNSALRLHGIMHSDKKHMYCPSCHCYFLTTASLEAHQLTHRKAEHCNTPENVKTCEVKEETQKEDFMALLELKNKEGEKGSSKEKPREPFFENMSYFVNGKPEMPVALPCASKGDSDHSDFADIQSIISVTSKSPLVPTIGTSPAVAVSSSPVPQNTGSSCIPPDSPPPADSANASPETPSREDSERSSRKGSEDHDTDEAPPREGLKRGHFACRVCNLSFKNRNALKKHKRSHSNGNCSSSFSCNMCPYTSLDKSTLIRHLRTHNGERPFQCAICKYAFTTKANCERHVRKRHKKLSKHEIRNSMQYNPNMTNVKTPEILIPEISASETVCKYCNVDFKFNRVLRHHLRSLHNSCSRKPFFCILCKLGFSTKNNCIRHVLKQHPDKKDKVQDIVSANSQSDLSDQDSIQMSDDTPHKEVPSETDQPLNLSVKISPSSSRCSIISHDTEAVNDIVTAVNGLVSLSEIPPPQEEPLDLAIHPLDLTLNSSKIIPDHVSSSALLLSIQSKLFNTRNTQSDTVLQRTSNVISSVVDLSELSVPSYSPVPALPSPVQATSHSSTVASVEDLSVFATRIQKEDDYKMSFKLVNDQLSSRNQRSFTCVYCSAGFTLKSNMERHIKRKHPEFARPTRSRNFIPTLTPHSPKSSTSTLSNRTRDALRVVLTSKAVASSPIKDDYHSSKNVFVDKPNIDLSDSESLIINESEETPHIGNQENLVIETDTCSKQTKSSEDNDTATDLASVSSVIDTANSQQFQQYLLNAQNDTTKAETEVKEKPKSDDPGEKITGNGSITKKRSSYTDSPNSVACPFCTRKFPWSSSLRRHILTHTGQKPYKCPRCPIWFTTKSNCERHLVRKHGQNSTEVLTRTVPDRPFKCNVCPSSTFSTQGNLRKHYYLKHWKKTGRRRRKALISNEKKIASNTPKRNCNQNLEKAANSDEQVEESDPGTLVIASEPLDNDLGEVDPQFKCHLCEESFTHRPECLDHLKKMHKEEYELLETKGAMDSQLLDHTQPLEDDIIDIKDSDGVHRKVICVLCSRRFWSAEDLRRHMRSHTGERPFACDICQRKFSLKHSMIRHRRKHHGVPSTLENDSTDEEHAPVTSAPPKPALSPLKKSSYNSPRTKKKSQNSLLYLMRLGDGNRGAWGNTSNKSISGEPSTVPNAKREDENTDLIQNLLGIHDSKIIDEMLDSADSAARLLGVGAEI